MKKKVKNKNQRRFPSQSLISTINVKSVRKARSYRHHLESLIGRRAIVTGVITERRENKICGQWSVSFLFEPMKALNYSCADTNHLWINCDYDFLRRNKLKVGDSPVLAGAFYEYRKNDTCGNVVRNIGFELDYVLDEEQCQKIKRRLNERI